ncbi:major facilitator superfamily domain-containing protein [Suillus spraguei]|nr:major facilitator superfamily domain-containing protein [Suillus spraguei]
MILQLVEPIASMSIFPYINQLIRELGITGGDDAAVGYYAGIIESLFFVAQTLTVLRWSRLSDRIGRKPVLLMGLSGTCISMLCFGLSTTFWGLVISRCMCGVLNGNVSVMKTMVGELTDSTNMAQGFALIPIMWCIGAFVGPLIGGTLSRPQDNWPRLFAHPFWSKYPYFLPCAVSACGLVLGFFVLLFFLEETLSTNCRPNLATTTLGIGADSENGESLSRTSNVSMRSLLTPTIIIPIANYAMLALLNVAFMALFYRLADGTFQALFFAKIVDWVGPKRLIFVLMFPIISWLVHTMGMADRIITFVLIGQLTLMIVWHMAFGTIFMFITASAPAKNVLGAVNGLAQTSGSMALVLILRLASLNTISYDPRSISIYYGTIHIQRTQADCSTDELAEYKRPDHLLL